VNVLHVAARLNRLAGLSHTIPPLCAHLARAGIHVSLSHVGTPHHIAGVQTWGHRSLPGLRSFAAAPGQLLRLAAEAGHVDLVHAHSLWSLGVLTAGIIVPHRRAALVMSPRGTLAPHALQFAHHKKRMVRSVQNLGLQRADLLHAASLLEMADFRAAGLRAPIAVIPNGVDVPDLLPPTPPTATRRLLFLSRIHPIKGVHELLHAWRSLQHTHPDWSLTIAGAGRAAHVQAVHALVRDLHLARTDLPGPAFDVDKERLFADSEIVVLPTHTDSFAMVVAEALARARPVVVGTGAPWADVVTHQCGWSTAPAVESLAATLHDAMSCARSDLRAMGQRGRAWMQRDFTWPSVASRMLAAYTWVLGGPRSPDVS